MRISVVGLGYLGAVHATALASVGFDVIGVDLDSEKVAALAGGVPPFHEPRFDELLTQTLASGRLRFSTDTADVADCDIHFLCVGTPQQADGVAADLSQVWDALDTLVPLMSDDSVLVGKSTVPVGTAAQIVERLRESGSRTTVLWNPEFLREGFAVRDTLEPDRIVVGATSDPRGNEAIARLRQVYAAPISAGTPFLVTDLATAELVKVAANSFLATKISFINAMAEICEATGADVTQLATAIGHDSRIGSQFLRAGVGFGGGCLPKDIRAFMARAQDLGLSDSVRFLSEVDAINDRTRQRAVVAAEDMLGSVPGSTVVVLGAAFKPDSDDTRDSPALGIAGQLHARGARVRVHDPHALANAARSHPQLEYEPHLMTALVDADLVMVLTEWREYVTLDPASVGGLVRTRRVFDGRNCLPARQWQEAGWRYRGVGFSGSVVDVRSALPR